MSTPAPAAAPATAARTLPVTLAATDRSLRSLSRTPALLISPLAQALFFMLIYAGQLGVVGEQYLDGRPFIAFLLPLILLTTVATAAGAAGSLVLADTTSGYLDRLRLAHGSITPFVTGTVAAVLVAVAGQVVLTTAGAAALGYRIIHAEGTLLAAALLLPLAASIALMSVAAAVRTGSAQATGLVALVVFGLSFFTGFFVPRDQLTGWMSLVASWNPLTPVVEAMRQLDAGAAPDALGWALAALTTLVVLACAACVGAFAHARRTR